MALEIVYLPPQSLKPYERNTRKHEPADIEQIKQSIMLDGFNDPIGIWGGENLIVEGHGRQIAAMELGLETVPCIRLDHMTDEQRRDYAIRHNRTAELSSWDEINLDIEMQELEDKGFDMQGLRFDELFVEEKKEPEELLEDTAPSIPDEPKAKRGQIYQLGDHRLMCGDATSSADLRALMDGGLADLVVTDPPYNVDYHGGTGLTIQNDSMADADFCRFLTNAFSAMSASMKPGCSFYIWHADSEGYNFRRACVNAGLQVRQCLIWVKDRLVLGRQDYQWKHEPCLYGWKDGGPHYWAGGRKQRTTITAVDLYELRNKTESELLRFIEEHWCDLEPTETSVLYEEKPTRNGEHPTMKPIKLIGRLVRNSSQDGGIVLDTFGGSGSTLIACEQLGRACRMMELDPRYVDVIVSRWEQFTGKKAILLKGGE
jgi:site-specific DNA-methyltransferase (adenine-specific)